MGTEELFPLLACPQCRASVVPGETALPTLVCRGCRAVYPISAEGVPILLSPASQQVLASEQASYAGSLLARAPQPPRSRLLKRLLVPPTPSLNTSLARITTLFHTHLPPGARVLVLGGFRPTDGAIFERYRAHSLDIAPGPGVQVIGDGCELPFLADVWDGVVAQAVLEHVRRARTVVTEIHRVLRPSGLVYVSVPFLQPYHYGPLDYQRYTITGLEALMADFRRLESGVAAGPGTALAWMLRYYGASWSDNVYLRAMLQMVIGWLTFPLRYTDLYLNRKRGAYLAAAALYFVGQKPVG